MANVAIKISQLKQLTGSAITNDDFLPIVDSGSLKTYRITLADIINKTQGGVATLLGGNDKQIIYNNGGIIKGDNALQFNYVSKSLQNGSGSLAYGLYSHAEGYQTFTSGVYAHVEGYQTYAYGTASHAGGYQTYAYGDYQTVVGQFNVNSPRDTTSLFIVGGGINDLNRKDILLVDRTGITVNGDINFSGSLYKNNSLYISPTASFAYTAAFALNGGGVGGSSMWSYTNSGLAIYYSSSNTLVGIGTTNPQYTLDVNGIIGNSNSALILSSSAGIGINTANPQYTLDVAGNIKLTGYIGNNPSLSSNFVGSNAGNNATSANNSNFFGNGAGNGATSANNSNFFGNGAGNSATYANNSNFLGFNAGNAATSASNSNFFGTGAGRYSTNANNSNFFGQNAGYAATSARNSNFFGVSAGNYATSANNSNFFGNRAGYYATSASNSNFFGNRTGYYATNAYYSNFFGNYAGNYATNAINSNFFGTYAGAGGNYLDDGSAVSFGYYATNAYDSNFFGRYAGNSATYANNSNFLGTFAGNSAVNANNSIFIGTYAGGTAVTGGITGTGGAWHANNSIFIGYKAGYEDTVDNSFGPKSSILIGDFTSTGGNSDSIAIGKGTRNNATQQFNIGNVLYGLNIYTGSTSTSTPQTNGKVGVGTNNPSYTLDVNGSTRTLGFVSPVSSSIIPTATGSMFYSGSKLFIYTGTGNAGGLSGWQTASLGG